MPSLISGSNLNPSSPSNYAALGDVQYKLGPTPSTSTGYTLITDADSKSTFVSSLGNLQFTSGTVYSNIVNQNIQFIGTGTGTVIVSGPQLNTSTTTGVLVIQGGIGIANGLHTGEDIYVNGLRIGQGYQGYNNIVIQGIADTAGQNSPDGENSIGIGYNTLGGINNSLNTIAIGNYALSTGTYTVNTIALGNHSLYKAGTIKSILIGNITTILTGSTTTVSVNNHGLSTGTEIIINGVTGTTELNDQNYLVDVIDQDKLELFSIYDPNLSTPVISSNAYISGGTVSRTWSTQNNIGIGTFAAASFYQGVDNLFIGHNVANQFTTGSYNLIMGPADTANNMTHGNSNISIDGNQLVDGLNGQIGIGSIFYYNGGGYLQLETNVGLGLGDDSSNSTNTGALVVYGGMGVSRSLYVGTNLIANGDGIVTLSPNGGDVTMEPTGGGSVIIYPQSNSPGNMDNMYIGSYQPRDGTFVDVYSQNVQVSSTASSTSTITGALTVVGGVGIGGTMYVSGFRTTSTNYSLFYNTLTNEITFDAAAGDGGGNGISSTSTNTYNVYVQNVATNTVYYPSLVETIGDFSPIDGDYNLTYDTTDNKLTVPMLAVTSSTISTSSTTGALTVSGGVGIQGSVYSQDGNIQENYLLYSPKVSVSSTVPTTSTNKVGDIWIDLTSLAYYQWIDDDGTRFWLQITIL